MITKFKVKNLVTDDTVIFGQDVDCNYLYKSGGVDWGNVPAAHNTYNYPGQVGDSIYSTKINSRSISITAYAYYILSKDEIDGLKRSERLALGYERLKESKRVINEIFNPDNMLRLSTSGYYIDGIPSASPQYGTDESENNEFFCAFNVELFCSSPMFHKETDVLKAIAGDYPVFHFPFIVVDEYKYIMGTRVDYLQLIVENEGNVPVGGKITFVAKGHIVNPSVKNVETGEKIVVRKVMENGDRIVINTVEGKDRGIFGIKGDKQENYLQYWSFSNTWLKFNKGTTMIEYSTENQSENNLEVLIEINPQKYALEEM